MIHHQEQSDERARPMNHHRELKKQSVASSAGRPPCAVAGALPALIVLACVLSTDVGASEAQGVRLRIAPQEPWKPPYGLERVTTPLHATVHAARGQREGAFRLAWIADGKEGDRVDVPVRKGRLQPVGVPPVATGVVLYARTSGDKDEIIARETLPGWRVALEARAVEAANPVDLGYIMPPYDHLVVRGGAAATLSASVRRRYGNVDKLTIRAWYASQSGTVVETPVAIGAEGRANVSLALPLAPTSGTDDVLQVRLLGADGVEQWSGTVLVALSQAKSALPKMGAVATKLAYPLPIHTTKGPIPYADGWKPEFEDVVVCLPNGGRFVFWRGASYAPFWAWRSNIGLCYQWAEFPRKYVRGGDCVEPLWDKELRYSRVEIVESTPAHVHVRWRYRSCNIGYQVGVDYTIEDFHFYPDGMGVRNLECVYPPGTLAQISDFIPVHPPMGVPLRQVPAGTPFIDCLWGQMEKVSFTSPLKSDKRLAERIATAGRNGEAALLRFRLAAADQDPLAAIYFSPRLTDSRVGRFFKANRSGQFGYWGAHWPLTRGIGTSYAGLNGNVTKTCSHSGTFGSLVLTNASHDAPLFDETGDMPDAEGKIRHLQRSRWAWLIGMTAASDVVLRRWMASYTRPPEVAAEGANVLDDHAWALRRAIRLQRESDTVRLTVTPRGCCMNPVFRFTHRAGDLRRLVLDDRAVPASRYVWDGQNLWLSAQIQQPARLEMDFATGEVHDHPPRSGKQ